MSFFKVIWEEGSSHPNIWENTPVTTSANPRDSTVVGKLPAATLTTRAEARSRNSNMSPVAKGEKREQSMWFAVKPFAKETWGRVCLCRFFKVKAIVRTVLMNIFYFTGFNSDTLSYVLFFEIKLHLSEHLHH
jgi:hypothetical protein